MFMKSYTAIVICLLKCASADLVVQTNSGPIQGMNALSEDIEAFLGIPYAEPPVGDLRFAKPAPKKPWTEILNASTLPPPCAQFSMDFEFYFMPDITNMSEDCLYLNLWSPTSISNNTLKPVIIFLHPGAFMTGTSSMNAYDGSKFAKRGDVVVVTINYRLGPFGYFLANVEEAAGNMGMYDQVMAIKWVKDNAVLFGGDPENIVLMGESAGAISVVAHVVSPISKNLFQKAIIQSGSVLNTYFFDNNTRLFRNSEAVASITGCSNETTTLKSDPYSVIACLKRQPTESLLQAEKILLTSNFIVFYLSTGDEFLPEHVVDYLLAGKFRRDVPVMLGINADEGTLLLAIGTPDYFGAYGENNVAMNKYVAAISVRALAAVAKIPNSSEVLDYYMSHVKGRNALRYTKMVANVIGDYSVACGTIFQADIISLKENPVYFYKFSFRPHSTPMADWMGTTHLDEMQYIFGNPYYGNFTDEEIKLSHHLMDRWSAFARTGNPNIHGHIPWMLYSYRNPFYLSIEQEDESIRMKPLERCKVWRKIFRAVID